MSRYFQDRDELGAKDLSEQFGEEEVIAEGDLREAEVNLLMAAHELDSLMGDDPTKYAGMKHLASAIGILERETEAEVTMEITEEAYQFRWKEMTEAAPAPVGEQLRVGLGPEWEVDEDGDEWATAYRDDDEVKREITVRKSGEEWLAEASGPNLQRWPSGTPWDLHEGTSSETLGGAVDEALRMAREAEEEDDEEQEA